MTTIDSPSKNLPPDKFRRRQKAFEQVRAQYRDEIARIRRGGGVKAIERQHSKKRLTAWERIDLLKDEGSDFLELGLFAAWGMYEEYGSPPAAGLIVGIIKVAGHDTIVVANDATVKAGAYFEVTLKKNLRAQELALENHLPIVYLVDSAGVFLPLQDQVFPDEAHFGRIFYNNARMSALGIPQIAAVMGPCVAGGAYLPVMCDKYIMVEGSNMFLAGPALVKAAIGQDIDAETLGGATTHNAISGTADYHEPDDAAALERVCSIMASINHPTARAFNRAATREPLYSADEIPGFIYPPETTQYDLKELLARLLDGSEFDEYKATYGKTLVCGTGRLGGYAVGIVGNQKVSTRSGSGEMQMGGVIYSDAADKAARFIMNCNQDRVPIIFIHDVNGFMVGRDAEWGGIAKDGAKMVNAVANSTVPKITLVIGGSYGAGNYALCGKAYNPRFIFAWPTARIAVMGGAQAANTLADIQLARMKNATDADRKRIVSEVKERYEVQSDPRYAAARLWIDEIIMPGETRQTLIRCLELCDHQTEMPAPRFGVLQV
ncbi:MAG: acyl-CoA carboxylase subunit beta [Candidatus Marinimicrobia bacterium]|nr:acyl-CoA carboxylase subunit beta [Candidatus Neomarinimicrobiota bacterium]